MNQEKKPISNPDPVSLCRVGVENFNREVMGESRPVLILCMPNDAALPGQIAEFEKVRIDMLQDLKMCLLEEGFIGVFKEQFNVRGTPTFLIFCDGVERARLLGRASSQELNRFVVKSLVDQRSSAI